MKQIILLTIFILTVSTVFSQSNTKGDSCKKESNSEGTQKEDIESQNTININAIENNIEMNTKEDYQRTPKLHQELQEDNYSPKAVYFEVVAKELKYIYVQKLT